jgi:quercetin dioxygenase-like cupin family protein
VLSKALTLEATGVEKVEMFPGFWRQTLVSGDRLMLCLFTWRAGATLPAHAHHHEQVGYVASGVVELTVSGRTMLTCSGCSYFIPSNEIHSARALEDSIVIDAFSPPREEYRATPSAGPDVAQ